MGDLFGLIGDVTGAGIIGQQSGLLSGRTTFSIQHDLANVNRNALLAQQQAQMAAMMNAYRPVEQLAPLDPLADSTFAAWLAADDFRTLEEFAADGGSPSTETPDNDD